MNRDHLHEDKKFALKNCKILYGNVNKPCTETCACWGWEFGDGWNPIVKELSTKIEMLNMLYYPKYGVYTVMDQAKEKFGQLHFYYSTLIQTPFFLRIWKLPFEKMYNWMRRNISFGMVSVVDEKGYYVDEKELIPDDEVEERKELAKHVSNVKVVEDNGKWYEISHMWHMEKTHLEATEHKLLYKIQNIMFKLMCKLTFYKEPTTKQLIVQDAVRQAVEQYVSEAVEKCYNVCEDCGTPIGTEWSPRVTTNGWISYICESCNSKRNIKYAMDSINYNVKHRGIVLTDGDKTKVETISNALESDKYVSPEEYKKMEDEIKTIRDKIDVELVNLGGKDNK